MTRYRLGVNNCFAVKRWPEPEEWGTIVCDAMGLDLVQHSFDLVELGGAPTLWRGQAQRVKQACERFGLSLHSTFTGLAAYSSNLLLDPDPAVRQQAERWYESAIAFTAAVGGRATGGHVGAFSVSDWRDPKRRREREQGLIASLRRLAAEARSAQLSELYIENLAAAREPSTMDGVARLLTDGDPAHVPIRLCLDVGHQCVPGTSGAERDPYVWLEGLGSKAPVVQLQQSDAEGDHHWPFTASFNARGRIEAGRVLDALDRSGAEEVALILEVIPPFEQNDEQVLDDMVASAAYWRDALARRQR
jgi:D-erythrulose 1-phosphate 3-epimerase